MILRRIIGVTIWQILWVIFSWYDSWLTAGTENILASIFSLTWDLSQIETGQKSGRSTTLNLNPTQVYLTFLDIHILLPHIPAFSTSFGYSNQDHSRHDAFPASCIMTGNTYRLGTTPRLYLHCLCLCSLLYKIHAIIIPFYRWRNWGLWTFGDLPGHTANDWWCQNSNQVLCHHSMCSHSFCQTIFFHLRGNIGVLISWRLTYNEGHD